MPPLHARTHPSLNVEGCFGCKVTGIQVSADAMPFRKARTAGANRDERQAHKDHAAYRRLRKEGLQPPTFVGAHMMERDSRTKDEVEAGRRLPGDGNLRPDLIPQ